MTAPDFEQLLSIGELVLGILLILCRKRFSQVWLKSQIGKLKPPEKEALAQVSELGYKGVLLKVEEIGLLVVGLVFVASSLSHLFFPRVESFVADVSIAIVLAVFAAGGAILIMLLILPLVWRKVNDYLNEKYAELYLQSKSRSLMEKHYAAKSIKQIDDPVLHKLQKKATIYTAICFSVLFVMILFAIWMIIRATK